MTPPTTPDDRTASGQTAEALAQAHLEAAGLSTVGRNIRSRMGEIDLVMRDADCIVFVEVRYRRDTRFGTPVETVDARKQRKLVNTALWFMQKYDPTGRMNYRFDVVGITGELSRTPPIQWIRSAF